MSQSRHPTRQAIPRRNHGARVRQRRGRSHVCVKQHRHSWSSSARTSSEVTTVPTLTRGSPVRGSTDVAVERPARRPRWMRSATVSLNVRRVSRAIACTCLCSSSGMSIVVRTLHTSVTASRCGGAFGRPFNLLTDRVLHQGFTVTSGSTFWPPSPCPALASHLPHQHLDCGHDTCGNAISDAVSLSPAIPQFPTTMVPGNCCARDRCDNNA